MALRERWHHLKRALSPRSTRHGDVEHTGHSTLDALLHSITGTGSTVNAGKIVREGYGENLNVYTNVQKLATAAKAVPWDVKTEQRDGELEDTNPDHPVRRLLDRPNPWHTWQYLVEHFIGSLILTGDAYAILNGPTGGPPREILPLPPHQVKPETGRGANAGPTSYKLQHAGREETLDVEDVVHVWSWSPTDMFDGQGAIEPSAIDVDLLTQFRKWNRALTMNGAQPSLVAWAEERLSDTQYQRLLNQLKEDQAGAANAGDILLLEELAGVDTGSFNPQEMNWVEGMREERRDLAVAMGVPPELVGDPEVKTYNNAKRAQLAIYQQKVFPMLKQVAQILQQKLRAFPDLGDVVVQVNKEDTPAVQEQRRETMDALVQGVRFGILTPNEARDMLGMEPADEGADDLLRPMSLAPTGGGGGTGAPPPEGDPLEEQEETEPEDERAAVGRVNGH